MSMYAQPDNQADQNAITRMDKGAGVMKTPDQVNYRPADNEGQSCSDCVNFDFQNKRCHLVTGQIDPTYVCDLFQSDEAPQSGQPGQPGRPMMPPTPAGSVGA